MVGVFYFLFDGGDEGLDEEVFVRDGQADEGVGGDELGFQIGKGADAVVVLFVAVGLLVADERDEKAEFGDLDGDGLYVHAVEAVFDEVELAAVVVVVVGKGAFEFLAHGGGVELGELGFLPAFVAGV